MTCNSVVIRSGYSLNETLQHYRYVAFVDIGTWHTLVCRVNPLLPRTEDILLTYKNLTVINCFEGGYFLSCCAV